MVSGNNSNSTSKGPNPQIQSFLESLRNRSSSRPENQSRPSFEGSSFQKFQERKKLEERRRAEFFQFRTREFNEVYSLTKKQEEKKTEEIRLRLQQLSKEVDKFNNQLRTAATTRVVNPGRYHLNFLEHLLEVIELTRKNLSESNTWLQLFNSRSKKKGYYWDQAGKQGTKFTQALDRSVATSVG